MPTPIEILKQYWGHSAFRPMQEDIIQSVIEKQDTLALLPTGGGKSVCFQVPALMMEGICLVITPLIALMKDQVEQLRRKKITAHAIYSGMSYKEIDIILDNCVHGKVKFLYVSPERLKTELMIERAKKMNVCLLAVDEAHCISQWGYDFRPPYLQIAQFREFIPDVPVVALTATATEQVRGDIQEKLEFKNGNLFVQSFARANLSYSVRWSENKEQKLIEIFKNVPGTGVVYVRNRKRCKEIATVLSKAGISAEFYHAGLNNQERTLKQDRWVQNRVRIIVATNAFGMGIDKPDVRVVAHLDLPDNLEAYYQEAGRAGRDGKKAYAVILLHQKDLDDLQLRVEQNYPTLEYIRRVYQSLANYYKIAVGSNLLVSYDFDLKAFASTFNLSHFEAYQALKRLEQEGFIQLNETFYNPSKLYINVNKGKLYEFQIAHANMDYFVKALLRIYGGDLFSGFQVIFEAQIAKLLNISTEEVVKRLQFLHQSDVAIYDQRKEQPQITFLTHRYDASKLPIDNLLLQKRRQLQLDKMQAVKAYASNELRCRTQMLLAYFDEESYLKCGICDNCLSNKSVQLSGEEFDLVRLEVLKILENAALAPEELKAALSKPYQKIAIDVMRIMLDQEEIKYDEQGRLVLK
jgi:ATP-dependent DNA helicase RecQ